jgi:SAM-dependent methyltransferase
MSSIERASLGSRRAGGLGIDGVARVVDSSPLQSQFCLPRGILGRVVGWFMARENQSMNRAAVRLLAAGPQDDLLEIGFGPGGAIELLAKRTAVRWIAGVDPSDVMVDQAMARNRESIDAGRVALLRGAVDALPFPDNRFTKAVAINNFRIWDSRKRGLLEIKRVLKPRGLLLLCLRRQAAGLHWWTSPGLSTVELNESRALVEDAGFHDVRLVTRRLAPRTVCMLASK